MSRLSEPLVLELLVASGLLNRHLVGLRGEHNSKHTNPLVGAVGQTGDHG